MEDFERRVWDVSCRWLAIQADRASIEWAKDYAIADLKTELETLGAMQASGFPAEAIRQQQKKIAALLFATAEQDEVQAMGHRSAVDRGIAGTLDGTRERGGAGTNALVLETTGNGARRRGERPGTRRMSEVRPVPA